MGVKDVDFPVLAGLALLVLIPAIPGVLLWFFLQPATFWQKLAWFVVSSVCYVAFSVLEALVIE